MYDFRLRAQRVKALTDKLWSSKDVLEFISCFNLVSDPKINQLYPGVGHVLVQQHDIFRLRDKQK